MPAPFSVAGPAADVAAANQIKQAGNLLFQSMVRTYIGNFRQVWNNPLVTPPQIVAAMGADAVKLFTLSAGLAQLLAAAGATDIPMTMPTGWSFAANPDGSATLTQVS